MFLYSFQLHTLFIAFYCFLWLATKFGLFRHNHFWVCSPLPYSGRLLSIFIPCLHQVIDDGQRVRVIERFDCRIDFCLLFR